MQRQIANGGCLTGVNNFIICISRHFVMIHIIGRLATPAVSKLILQGCTGYEEISSGDTYQEF